MAGRPPLRIGQHGKITRTDLGSGVWLARCRFRDRDGVTRIVERRTPTGSTDKYGDKAEAALVAALDGRRPPTADVSASTLVVDLMKDHVARLREAGELSPVSIDVYERAVLVARPRMAGLKVSDLDPALLHDLLAGIRQAHGDRERAVRAVLNAVLTRAVMAKAIDTNPMRELGRTRRKSEGPKGAPALDPTEVLRAYKRVRTSAYCRRADLRDPVLTLIGTGVRRSEVLGMRWSDIDLDHATANISGRVVRIKGDGLVWLPATKSGAPGRTVPLPAFVVAALRARRTSRISDTWVFPSTSGGLRDPDNFNKQWRRARGLFDLDQVTSHSWRKTLATVIDDAGLSARIGADQLGHARPSMTQDVYWKRGSVHTEVAAAIDKIVR
ncbi:tyrosine-type recombinase/integrase [Gordonia tangerina]|uniref:Site-specific integrase n=1 Tax=Gordonia tangerina TaxID=2911060 RepID=A0ABS9DSV8_9ACTN|nr:site-specific integrase [Gordonia tangerina]MCF3940908.1 site-specific integrase [Gordonia tangerina]